MYTVFQFCLCCKNSYGFYRRVYRREEKEFERNRATILDSFGLDVHLQPMSNLASDAPAAGSGQPAAANWTTGAGDGAAGDGDAYAQQELLVGPNEDAIGASSEQLLASTPTTPLEKGPHVFSMPANVMYPTLTSVDVEIAANKSLCSTQVLTYKYTRILLLYLVFAHFTFSNVSYFTILCFENYCCSFWNTMLKLSTR